MQILLSIPAPLWLFLSALFFAWGEYMSKQWAYAPGIPITIATIAIYACATLSWLPALLHKNQLAVMGTAWLLLATVATVAIGILVYHEPVGGIQSLGIVLSIVSLVLLSV